MSAQSQKKRETCNPPLSAPGAVPEVIIPTTRKNHRKESEHEGTDLFRANNGDQTKMTSKSEVSTNNEDETEAGNNNNNHQITNNESDAESNNVTVIENGREPTESTVESVIPRVHAAHVFEEIPYNEHVMENNNEDVIDGVLISTRNSSSSNQSSQLTRENKTSKNRLKIFLFAGLLILLIALASFLIARSLRQKSSPASSSTNLTKSDLNTTIESPSPAPSKNPLLTLPPTSERFQSIATAVYGSIDHPLGEEEASFRAMKWLADDDEALVSLNETKRLRQRFALAVMYFSLGGDNWRDNCGFLSKDHECNWNKVVPDALDEKYDSTFLKMLRGVVCLSDDVGLVTGISLTNMNMKGPIPVEIGMFSDLSLILLGKNEISGSIPSSIWNLPYSSLFDSFQIDLAINKLTGTIPHITTKDFDPSKIFLLEMTQNLLTGTIPPSVVANNTVFLGLSFNLLTGEIPKSTRNEKISSFGSTGNLLTGSLPFSPTSYPNLEVLDISNNDLYGSIDSLLHLPKSRLLSMSYNSFSGTIPSLLFTLSDLRVFGIAKNNLTGTIPKSMSSTGLTMMDISSNHLVGNLPSEIGKLTNLTYFAASNNTLNGTIPWSIGNLDELLLLSIFKNNISGTIPRSVGNLSKMVSFSVSANSLNGTIPSVIGNMTNLESLSLFSNHFSGTLPKSFIKLTSLNVLVLEDNDFTGSLDFLCGDSYDNWIRAFRYDCFELNCSCCTVCCVNETSCYYTQRL